MMQISIALGNIAMRVLEIVSGINIPGNIQALRPIVDSLMVRRLAAYMQIPVEKDAYQAGGAAAGMLLNS
jgi:hypothetical protein